MIFQTSMIMFHVNLQGCTLYSKASFVNTKGGASYHIIRWPGGTGLASNLVTRISWATTFVKKMKGANLNSCESIIQKKQFICNWNISVSKSYSFIFSILYLHNAMLRCTSKVHTRPQATLKERHHTHTATNTQSWDVPLRVYLLSILLINIMIWAVESKW